MQAKFIIALLAAATTAYAEENVFIPAAPDYDNELMWHTELNDTSGQGADVFYVVSTWEFDWKDGVGRTSHYADPWSDKHRSDMNIEQSKVAEYMADGNNFYAPYYRHITLDSWATLNEDTIAARVALSMADVKQAFDWFQAHRDTSRPFILAGFSQGGKGVVELIKHIDDDTMQNLVAAYVLGYKVTPADTTECHRFHAAQGADDLGVTICYNTVKDVNYIKPVVSAPCVMCINPVNWRTDSMPAVLADSITVTMSPRHNVLVATGYAATEYPNILNILNVGDIHGCEPWLYSECLRRNMALRVRRWHEQHQ
jgi:hypothetical protein